MKAVSNRKNFRELYNSTIFTNIYKRNAWGGKKGEFYSGAGSHNAYIDEYAGIVSDFVIRHNINDIVEIGCGDFNVSNAILNKLNNSDYRFTYTGYDVVKPLIAQNTSKYGSSTVKFVCKDSCVGTVKTGDLLIIRQVLQHLSNKSIKQIIDKFKNYKYIIFTEHQPADKYNAIIKPNINQPSSAENRLRFKSAVYLDKAPFNCVVHSKLFSIMEWVYGMEAYINTFLIKN
ncbi:hypothetical protein ACFS5N_07465 [Mucilaginibacter ximonensis]|uniref:Methyltransferase family protein n=1 Tax=Mucilaginibacter ximonensis TaxID=538021 RepID=A0ABW5YAI6_9SPHI